MKYRLNAATVTIPTDATNEGFIVELPQNIIVLDTTYEQYTLRIAYLEPLIEPTV